MKTKHLILSILITLASISISSCSKSEPSKTVTKGEEKTNSDSLSVAAATFNALCPISGEPVNAEANKVEHQGKVYGFCCNGCDEKFKSNPEKYAANISTDGKSFVGKTESMH